MEMEVNSNEDDRGGGNGDGREGKEIIEMKGAVIDICIRNWHVHSVCLSQPEINNPKFHLILTHCIQGKKSKGFKNTLLQLPSHRYTGKTSASFCSWYIAGIYYVNQMLLHYPKDYYQNAVTYYNQREIFYRFDS